MPHITFLGAGNAAVLPEKLPGGGFDCAWQSNLLLQSDSGKKILLDAGTDIRLSLFEAGVKPSELEGIYISHNHADHVGGLEYLAFDAYFASPRRRPLLLVTKETLHAIRRGVEAGLSPVNGEHLYLEDVFELTLLSMMQPYIFERVMLTPHAMVHVPGGTEKISYGLSMSCPDSEQTLFWTSDTVFNRQAYRVYEHDIILHDCQVGTPNGVHAHLDELRTLSPDLKKKMWLYHHDPRLVRDAHVPDGEFAGFARKGTRVTF